jgi:hypothetical protein
MTIGTDGNTDESVIARFGLDVSSALAWLSLSYLSYQVISTSVICPSFFFFFSISILPFSPLSSKVLRSGKVLLPVFYNGDCFKGRPWRSRI